MKKSWGIVLLAMLMFASSATAMSSSKHIDPCWLLAHTPAPSGAQAITVVNQAGVKPENVCRVELAVQEQAWQLRAAWGTPPITFGLGGWKVYLKGNGYSGDLGGSAGVHLAACTGPYCVSGCVDVECNADTFTPLAEVAVTGACVNLLCTHQQAWSVAASHEVMEMLVNPLALNTGTEVCDPVWQYSYEVAGVRVSDFVLPILHDEIWLLALRKSDRRNSNP